MKHLIFDFDGVIAQNAQSVAYRLFCQGIKAYGYEFTIDECFERFLGMTIRNIVKSLNHARNPKRHDIIPVNFFDAYDEQCLEDLAQFGTVDRHLVSLINHCDSVSVCSSNLQRHITHFLSAKGLMSYFPLESLFTFESVEHHKPAPDVYQKCLRNLHLNPTDVCVIEDSAVGVQSAIAAGLRVYGYIAGTPAHLRDNHSAELTALGVDSVIECFSELIPGH